MGRQCLRSQILVRSSLVQIALLASHDAMGVGLDYCPMTLVSEGGSLRIFEKFSFDRFGLLSRLRCTVLNRLNRFDLHLISSQGPVGVQFGEFIFDADQRFMPSLSMLAIGIAGR